MVNASSPGPTRAGNASMTAPSPALAHPNPATCGSPKPPPKPIGLRPTPPHTLPPPPPGAGEAGVVQPRKKPTLPPKPKLDSYRFSMVNLQESPDVDLDALLGELCELESALSGNGSQPTNGNWLTQIGASPKPKAQPNKPTPAVKPKPPATPTKPGSNPALRLATNQISTQIDNNNLTVNGHPPADQKLKNDDNNNLNAAQNRTNNYAPNGVAQLSKPTSLPSTISSSLTGKLQQFSPTAEHVPEPLSLSTTPVAPTNGNYLTSPPAQLETPIAQQPDFLPGAKLPSPLKTPPSPGSNIPPEVDGAIAVSVGDLQHKTSDPNRQHSPDNDSAFCDSASMLSSEEAQSRYGGAQQSVVGPPRSGSRLQATSGDTCNGSNGSSAESSRASLTTPSPTQLMDNVQCHLRKVEEQIEQQDSLTEEQRQEKIKAEKIKIALEKMKEASVKKIYVKVFTADGSSRSLLVDERWTVDSVLRQLAEKYGTELSINHAIVEQCPDLHMERIYEDDEPLVENILMWTTDSTNKLMFALRPEKYCFINDPQEYLLSSTSSDRNYQLDTARRNQIVDEFFAPSHVQPPEIEGPLYLKADGKKAWKKHHCVLRASGLYYVPKGKYKSSKDLVCLMQLGTVQNYVGVGWKKKYKAPSEFGFALKHPQIQVKVSKYVKYFCAEDEATLKRWLVGLRIAKNGRQLYENHTAMTEFLTSTEGLNFQAHVRASAGQLSPKSMENGVQHHPSSPSGTGSSGLVVMRSKGSNEGSGLRPRSANIRGSFSGSISSGVGIPSSGSSSTTSYLRKGSATSGSRTAINIDIPSVPDSFPCPQVPQVGLSPASIRRGPSHPSHHSREASSAGSQTPTPGEIPGSPFDHSEHNGYPSNTIKRRPPSMSSSATEQAPPGSPLHGLPSSRQNGNQSPAIASGRLGQNLISPTNSPRIPLTEAISKHFAMNRSQPSVGYPSSTNLNASMADLGPVDDDSDEDLPPPPPELCATTIVAQNGGPAPVKGGRSSSGSGDQPPPMPQLSRSSHGPIPVTTPNPPQLANGLGMSKSEINARTQAESYANDVSYLQQPGSPYCRSVSSPAHNQPKMRPPAPPKRDDSTRLSTVSGIGSLQDLGGSIGGSPARLVNTTTESYQYEQHMQQQQQQQYEEHQQIHMQQQQNVYQVQQFQQQPNYQQHQPQHILHQQHLNATSLPNSPRSQAGGPPPVPAAKPKLPPKQSAPSSDSGGDLMSDLQKAMLKRRKQLADQGHVEP